ncbi:MAG: alpha-glucoside-specific PTS transporter subunit IIBC [Synergistaceae bacterium]|jgi:PTS system arbutin-like IIC component|nr:alpha-glucoside-specific PTS transporter subunit IIBC [Synergistaceae bacterium]
MMQKIQRFGGAMFTPVLLFAFAGIMAGLSTLFMNPAVMGSLTNADTLWFKIWAVVENGSWTVFRNMSLVFAVALPIGLAKKQNARACLEALILYLTFNYFLNQLLSQWGQYFGVDFESAGTGLASVAGIRTLDMGILGGLAVSGVVIFLHNRFFDTKLPEWLGIFKGSSLIFAMGFFVMIPLALLSAFIWPPVQRGIAAAQVYLVGGGVPGVGIYAFLNRILIPTGLHHFIYSPFLYDNLVVNGGIVSYWMQHMQEFAASSEPLMTLFPQGGFALYGMEKIFGSIGIALAFYATARPEKRKSLAGLLIPATLTAVFAGVTEPLEFTFLFVAPLLFLVHSILSGLLDATMYLFGVTGYFSGGLIEDITMNWVPLGASHGWTYLTQVIIGAVFAGIYFVVFRFLIEKFNFITPGRENDDEESRLYTKADFQEKQKHEKGVAANDTANQAAAILEALGGKGNITDLNNCATRLRVSVADESLVQDAAVFKVAGAHGVVVNGKAVQVIIGMSVPMVREAVEILLKKS